MGFDIEITGDPVRLDPRAINAEDAAEVQQILAATGGMTVDYLRSRTPEMRRPAPGRTNPRPAHPGHWADVTGNLARAYGHTVEGDTLWLDNTMPYARELEERDGFFVLSGVLEDGGVVDDHLRRVLEPLPGWEYSGQP